jgi:FAD/FMN-containing dehydrogenase
LQAPRRLRDNQVQEESGMKDIDVRRVEGGAQHPARVAAPGSTAPIDLATVLRKRVRGEVRFDAGSRALYATDLSIYRQPPIGVVIPRTIEEVIITVQECRQRGVPILGRGCGTSLAGQCCNVAVVVDFSKFLNRLVWLDSQRKLAHVEPGLIYDALNEATAKHRLTFPPDPATHQYCTLGGMIGNNSCGVHSVMGGRTVDNVEELDVLTYDGLRMRVGRTSDAELERIIAEGGRRGEIYRKLRDLRDRYASLVRERYPRIPRRVSGYNLDELLPEKGFNVARALVGTEATCVLVLGATLQLMHSPPHRAH